MIYSTLTRIAGSVLLFSIFVFAGFALLADTKHEGSTLKTAAATSADHIDDPLIHSADTQEAPVVKLASLSVITDYPTGATSELNIDSNMTVDGYLDAAKKLVEAQQFEEALRILDSAPKTSEDNYRIDYYRAQILSWSGNHADAESAFINLRAQYPQDADIAVSFGYLYLYQSKYDEAEHLFTQVLNRFPDYSDARRGLQRATAIQ